MPNQVGMRVCFFYSVGMSWDPRRVDGTDPKKRRPPVALWKEDFQLFMETMSQLVTSESENYIVVFPGRAKRQGAGLAVEAGLFVENQLLDIVRLSGKQWRTKRAIVVYKAAAAERFRGVNGGLQDRDMQIRTITTSRLQISSDSLFLATGDDCDVTVQPSTPSPGGREPSSR